MNDALIDDTSAPAPYQRLMSWARLSCSFKSSSRALPVCRFTKGPVAFRDDDSLTDQAKSVKQDVLNKLDVPSGAQQSGSEHIYKAFLDDRYEGAPRIFPAFTRRREHLVGRLAMLGCAAAWAGEVLTGQGPMQQYASALAVPQDATFWATIIFAAIHLVSGLSAQPPTQSPANKRDIELRSKGLTGNETIEPDVNRKADNIWQKLLRTELALGRSAMLIFLGVMLVENVLGGESPLAHFGLIQAGVPLSMAPAWLKFNIALLTAGGLGAFSLFDQSKDREAY
ncbi:hypothetical protein N2152v2_000136 [Parachlorella kessleri]